MLKLEKSKHLFRVNKSFSLNSFVNFKEWFVDVTNFRLNSPNELVLVGLTKLCFCSYNNKILWLNQIKFYWFKQIFFYECIHWLHWSTKITHVFAEYDISFPSTFQCWTWIWLPFVAIMPSLIDICK